MSNISTIRTTSQNSGSSLSLSPSHRERDDHYAKVIVQLGPRWRIIVCKDSHQWVLQKRSVAPPNTGTWAGKSYATTRDGLIAACSGRGLLSESSMVVILSALPDRIGAEA